MGRIAIYIHWDVPPSCFISTLIPSTAASRGKAAEQTPDIEAQFLATPKQVAIQRQTSRDDTGIGLDGTPGKGGGDDRIPVSDI